MASKPDLAMEASLMEMIDSSPQRDPGRKDAVQADSGQGGFSSDTTHVQAAPAVPANEEAQPADGKHGVAARQRDDAVSAPLAERKRELTQAGSAEAAGSGAFAAAGAAQSKEASQASTGPQARNVSAPPAAASANTPETTEAREASPAEPHAAAPSTVPAPEDAPEGVQVARGPYRRRKEEQDYERVFLVRRPGMDRKQTYVSLHVLEKINRFLPVIAGRISITNFIDNVLEDHLERYRERINELYDSKHVKPL